MFLLFYLERKKLENMAFNRGPLEGKTGGGERMGTIKVCKISTEYLKNQRNYE